MSDNVESTTLLDGTENLPDNIRVYKLIRARAEEICALENTIVQQKTGTKLLFQKLPVHMRRRAMSHRVKRLPRRLRRAHLRQMSKSGLTTVKKNSRKYRRRPENLLKEYNRRKRKHMWLETHIWHAKRFHMTNRWSCRLPERPCDKAFRACYRASAKHCLIQDISYINCVEITGPEEYLIEKFKQVTNSNTGLTISACAFRNGIREGRTIFYHPNSFPFNAIGEVSFMWKPTEPNNATRSLWLWIHPGYYSELINCLIDVFNLKLGNMQIDETNPMYENLEGIRLIELKQSLNRFKLTGPLSHAVIKKVVTLAPSENKTEWFRHYLESPINKSVFEEQVSYWESLQNINCTSEIFPFLIFNAIIVDPRYNLPLKRSKAVFDNYENVDLEINEKIKHGAIWYEDIRKQITNKSCNSTFISKQKCKLVPENTVPDDATVIPVMLIQQPGNRDARDNLGYCSGWDIIFPSNWARAFWISFIMRGARAGGLREFQSLRYEQGQPDLLAPDTEAGRTEESRIMELHRRKFFTLPPNKRMNYNKLSIVTPFNFRWKTLIQEWNPQGTSISNFYVLRARSKLITLQKMLTDSSLNINNVDIIFSENCLVPVRLNLIKKGNVKRFSIICLPETNDIKCKTEPTEPLRNDEHKKMRRDMRDAHKKILKKLRQQRIKARAEGKTEILSTKNIIEEQVLKMESLWLPEPQNIRNSCFREIFGFVTHGDFSFTNGHGRCVGYVVLSALVKLLSQNIRNIVLLRDTSSKQYRLANIEFVCL